MPLSERKLKILQAIIQNYLETGEPVGSRTISKYTDLNLSSATIRNEMADLEELGYIIQPHTSAGRIPTDKAYRLYVDTMMDNKIQEIDDMKDALMEKAGKLDNLLKEVAKLLAVNTNYASLVSGPTFESVKVKFIQLSAVDEYHLLAVIVLEGNLVKNKIIPSRGQIGQDMILKMNIMLNTCLQGRSLSEINMPLISSMKEQAGAYDTVVNDILDAISEAIQEEDDIEVYTSGATNILKYPELSDREKATELLYTLEEKRTLTQIMNEKLDGEQERGIQVYIGDETSVSSMKDCSLVTATYELGEGIYGKIGIVGPKRMDYEKVVGTLRKLMMELDEIFKER
ncbi:heat-inducible transcriptional repressor HrcA [Anaerolentibacter hominis]|uniref:heat-inducible transcriptional repressor HrcA n=1 Tax=Anaerolentibacter hominis TaxID=3079009 RepID=UPI0031B8697A